jgi:hypothetical protein
MIWMLWLGVEFMGFVARTIDESNVLKPRLSSHSCHRPPERTSPTPPGGSNRLRQMSRAF